MKELYHYGDKGKTDHSSLIVLYRENRRISGRVFLVSGLG
jgi:hypothetical protein